MTTKRIDIPDADHARLEALSNQYLISVKLLAARAVRDALESWETGGPPEIADR